MLLTQMLLSGAQKKASKLTDSWGYFVLIFCPALSISEPTCFVRLCSIRVTILQWLPLVGGRILLWIQLVHLLKTSILGSHLLFCYSSLEPWGAGPALVFPGSFLSLVVPEAVPASLPPGHPLSAKACMHPQDLALWGCSVRTRRILFISPLGSLRMMLTYLSWGRYLPVMCHAVTEPVCKNKLFLLSSCSLL